MAIAIATYAAPTEAKDEIAVVRAARKIVDFKSATIPGKIERPTVLVAIYEKTSEPLKIEDKVLQLLRKSIAAKPYEDKDPMLEVPTQYLIVSGLNPKGDLLLCLRSEDIISYVGVAGFTTTAFKAEPEVSEYHEIKNHELWNMLSDLFRPQPR